MIKIEIWGDSWGVPHRFDPQTETWNELGHTEHRLREMGYDVVNLSKNGAENSYSPRQSQIRNISSNYIVWFHTCLCREWLIESPYRDEDIVDLDIAIDLAAQRAYEEVARAKGNRKLIVVEGQNKLYNNYKNYFNVDYIIKDIKSKWTNSALPDSQWLTVSQIAFTTDPQSFWNTRCKDTKPNRTKHLTANLKTMDVLMQSPYFEDNCHPNNEVHKFISNKIHNFIVQDQAIGSN